MGRKMLDENILKRLAFIRYLFNLAVEQSHRPEPMCSSAILTFHDSIELFLQLGSEHLCISKKSNNFMEYWQLFKDEKNLELGQKISMRRLNNARVGLKHHGTLPAKLAIDDFQINVANFFDENTQLVFSVNFFEISLIELVESEKVKNSLLEAEEELTKGEYENSLDKVALAFRQLIDDYEDRKRDEFGRSPFFFGGSLTFVGSGYIGDTMVKMIPDEIIQSIEALQNAVNILSLGLDYRRYAKFRLLTPIVMRFIGGKYSIQRINVKKEVTEEEIRFCINFVIESAVLLQEFDY